ncbi:hypothetical protein FPZ12_024405 [Amycolatopsis acidicola]|uniref:Uncharacterized protein n=1 Tax=Amycolatopsis acidicola TaxID=2596893 RepID=A0A5N0V0W6_9PSEU|nr:hypothetical protein [Amycolatopsis acidicola]KAA9157784.1 hypothetical protein FPZ12_024405 [Amycolatopsis acidicola]
MPADSRRRAACPDAVLADPRLATARATLAPGMAWAALAPEAAQATRAPAIANRAAQAPHESARSGRVEVPDAAAFPTPHARILL